MMSKQISVAFLLSECDPGKDNYCREEEDLYLFHASVYLDNRATSRMRMKADGFSWTGSGNFEVAGKLPRP